MDAFQVPGIRERFVKALWERIVRRDDPASIANAYAYTPATAEYTVSMPILTRRTAEIGRLSPFTFLTVRYLESTALPEGASTFDLVPYLDPRKDGAAWLAPMDSPDGLTRSFASVVEQFLRHRDRKFLFAPDGTAVRRHIVVRRQNIHAIGKEAHHLETSIVLGRNAFGSGTIVYDDVIARILALPLSWAPKHGIDRANFARLRRKLRAGKVPRGHGARLLRRVKTFLRDE